MKSFYLILIYFFAFVSFTIAQNKVNITQRPKTVPDGKKWVLPTNQNIFVEVSSGSLNSGTMCNADLFSNPRILATVNEGEYGKPNKVYGILFKELEKVPFTNDYTYSIVPLSIIDENFKQSSLSTVSLEDAGKHQIIFTSGQKVFSGNCINSIQMIEYDLNQTELAKFNKIKKEKEEKEKSLTYRSNGDRILNIYYCNGSDDADEFDVRSILKIIISDKKGKVFTINNKNEIVDYGLRNISNLENGKQSISFGAFNEGTFTFHGDSVSLNMKLVHGGRTMGIANIRANGIFQLISEKDENDLLAKLKNEAVEKHIADSIEVNSFPRFVIKTIEFEAFLIKKKGNDRLKAEWLNKNKSIVNFSALIEDNGIKLSNIDDIPIYTELRNKLAESMQNKSKGMYYISFDVEEKTYEIAERSFETHVSNITLHEFYKGSYNNPKETYK